MSNTENIPKAKPGADEIIQPQPRALSPAAQRALAEADERRRLRSAAASVNSNEINGRGGLDPVRYGDWEVKGLTSDF